MQRLRRPGEWRRYAVHCQCGHRCSKTRRRPPTAKTVFASLIPQPSGHAHQMERRPANLGSHFCAGACVEQVQQHQCVPAVRCPVDGRDTILKQGRGGGRWVE